MEIRRPTSKASTSGELELLTDILPVVDTVYVAGPPIFLVWTGIVLLALMLAGPFALLVTLVLVVIVAAALIALAGAILATPYLVVRHLRSRAVA
jgi:hypothetical protein